MTKLTLTLVADDDAAALLTLRHLGTTLTIELGKKTELQTGPDVYKFACDYGNATCDVLHFTPATDITRLARKFTMHVLAFHDDEDDFNEINRRNRAEPDPAICHTHDFCDANILMSNAWAETFPAEPFCPQNPIHQDLHHAAWQKAKTAEFDLQRLPPPA